MEIAPSFSLAALPVGWRWLASSRAVPSQCTGQVVLVRLWSRLTMPFSVANERSLQLPLSVVITMEELWLQLQARLHELEEDRYRRPRTQKRCCGRLLPHLRCWLMSLLPLNINCLPLLLVKTPARTKSLSCPTQLLAGYPTLDKLVPEHLQRQCRRHQVMGDC